MRGQRQQLPIGLLGRELPVSGSNLLEERRDSGRRATKDRVSAAWAPWCVCTILLLLEVTLFCQAGPLGSGSAKFSSQVNLVVEDVQVTDGNGDPVQNLQKDDFVIKEDGKLQKILSFEEHRGLPVLGKGPYPLRSSIFTNERPPNSDAATVVLLDSLNTPLEDQAYVYTEVQQYLETRPTASRIAIFSLGAGLRLVQGFTADSSVLLSAMRQKRSAAPQESVMLQTTGQDNVNRRLISEMESMQAVHGTQQLQESIDDLKRLQAQEGDAQVRSGIQATLQAFQELAHYLAGIPGRKNVVWFSYAFQLPCSPGLRAELNDLPPSLDEELRRTDAELAAAHAAIYPIDAEGLAAPNQDPSKALIGITGAREATQAQSGALLMESVQRNQRHATMDEIASATGGTAFYNTNGFAYNLSRIVSRGDQYYILTYASAKKKASSAYRHIQINLVKRSYELAYRRGYYAAVPSRPADAEGDLLKTLMNAGMPDLAEVSYQLQVTPGSNGTMSEPKNSLDGRKAAGQRARYSLDFTIPVQGLRFQMVSAGEYNSTLEVAVAAYDEGGQMVGWTAKNVTFSLKPDVLAETERTGMHLHQDITVPESAAYVRTGILVVPSEATGTLMVPLDALPH